MQNITETDTPHAASSHIPPVFLRLLCGLLQGILLYTLYRTKQSTVWPATNGYLYAPMLLAALFVPVLFISAYGQLEKRALCKWLAAALLLCATLGAYDIWRMDFPAEWNVAHVAGVMPSYQLMVLTTAGFFIAHALVLAGAHDKRYLAAYPTYFETAWKLAVQLLFAGLFVAALWWILFLGSQLFMLIKLDFLQKLIQKEWFAIPVSTFALSAALHVTDVRPRIIQAIRNLLLTLMSWLLPIATLLIGGFLLSLAATGLQTLWATRYATSLLLAATALLVILINTAHQNGENQNEVARVLRITTRIACTLLFPLSIIAIYALSLRVQQYGWTIERIQASACLFLAFCYAAGYLWAAKEPVRIAHTNVLTAIMTLAVIIALHTPVADPARISINSQTARLENGKIPPLKFDFDYFVYNGARYGHAALRSLQANASGEHANAIRTQAGNAIEFSKKGKARDRFRRRNQPALATAQTRTENITAYPDKTPLPDDFLTQDWNADKNPYWIPECLQKANKQCNAYQIDMNGNGQRDILLESAYGSLYLFSQNDPHSPWVPIGQIHGKQKCKNVQQALKKGEYKTTPPKFNDLEVAGHRLRLIPEWQKNEEKNLVCER